MPAQRLSEARPHPMAGISFSIPTTEDGYGRLTASKQQQLMGALRSVDCANLPDLTGSSDRVVCDASGSFAALLGPPILTASDVASAKANPSAVVGSTEWTVDINLTASGARALHTWTSRYHSDRQTTGPVQTGAAKPCGPRGPVACSDFIAVVVGGQAVSIPITASVLDRLFQIDGKFTRAHATEFARQIAT